MLTQFPPSVHCTLDRRVAAVCCFAALDAHVKKSSAFMTQFPAPESLSPELGGRKSVAQRCGELSALYRSRLSSAACLHGGSEGGRTPVTFDCTDAHTLTAPYM